jgi:WD40 repeat protein
LAHPDASEFAGVAFDEEGRTLFAAANPVTVSPGKLPRGEIVRWVSKAGMAGLAAGPVARRATAASTEPVRSPASRPVEAPRASAAKMSRPRETKPLEGAEFRLPGNFMGTGGVTGLTSVAVHPTGELIAGATIISRLILWDVRTREVVAEAVLPPVSWPGYAIAFTQDGSHLICTIGDQVLVRSIPGLQEAQFEDASLNLQPEFLSVVRRIKIGDETFSINPVMTGSSPVSRDGQLVALATPGNSPVLDVISVPKKSRLFSVPLDDSAIQFGLSANGKVAYAVTRPAVARGAPVPSSTIERWEVPSGTPLGAVQGITGLIALSPDLERSFELANGMELYVRDLSTGKRAAAPFASAGGLRGVAFFPDGEHVATFGSTNSTRTWKITTSLKNPDNMLFRTAANLLVAPDGKTIAHLGASGMISLYDVAGHRVTRVALGSAPPVSTKAGARPRARGINNAARMPGLAPWHFSPDGRTLVAAGIVGAAHANPVAIDVQRGVELPIETMPDEVRPSGAPADQIFRWFLLAMHTASDSKMLYLLQGMQRGAAGGTRIEQPPYLLWDGQQSLALPALGETAGRLRVPCFSARGTFVAGVLPGMNRRTKGVVERTDAEIVVISASDGRLVSRIACGNDEVISLRFLIADDALLIQQRIQGKTGSDATFSLAGFDPKTGRELNRRAGLPSTFVAISDDGARLASAVDDAIVIESLPKKTELARIAFDDGPMRPVAFLAEGTKLITAGANGAIRLWDKSGRPISVPPVSEPARNVETAGPATKATDEPPVPPGGRRLSLEPPPGDPKTGKPSQVSLADELLVVATRLRGTPLGAYRGRFPALADGCEKLAAKLAAGKVPAAEMAREMERFVTDAKEIKEENGGMHSPYKDFCTTYTDRSGRSGLPGYKTKFFHEGRDLFGKPMSTARETPIQYGQRLFAEMIMTLERQIEDLTGKLPESSLLEEWRKAGPGGGGNKPGR